LPPEKSRLAWARLVGVVVVGPGQRVAGGAGGGRRQREVVAPPGLVADDLVRGDRGTGGAAAVEAPVGQGARYHDLAGRPAGPDRYRDEAGETLLEVDRRGEVVGCRGEPRLQGGHLVALLRFHLQEIRRDRFDVDHVAGQVEMVEPQHAGAAEVTVLVVGDVLVHLVARGVGRRHAPRRPEVTVEGQEDLVVVVDQLVPHWLAPVPASAELRRKPRRLGPAGVWDGESP